MIHIQEVSKTYGAIQALEHVELHIEKGSCFGLVGPNGAGKSTLMKILVGVLEEFNGSIQIDGRPANENRRNTKRKIGYVPQDICLEEILTARDNMLLFGKLYGLSGKELNERIRHVLQLIGLEKREKSIVSTFSGGMKRRLNIGCSLLHEPDIIILDEPTVGVDPQSRHAIFKLIHELKAEGKTIVYSSHYMEEVEQLCDSIGFIDQGTVVEHGTMKEVFAKHRHSSIFIEGEYVSMEVLAPFGEIVERERGYVITSQHPLSTLEKVAHALQSHGVQPTRLELSQTRLEDIFFELTGTQLRDKG
ncbi:ABC transporter ATP-binding protein [Jeotgalibacillus sp. JSM ZJ347]|uniref:ABC transporter ATP-binding protein n=1 Tax=Jeotgalibacillus sp. JSM ZJ347 TaxID=3342117 RepID=UPI0035A85C99